MSCSVCRADAPEAPPPRSAARAVRQLLLGAAGLLALAGCSHAPAEQLDLAEAIAQQGVDDADVDLDLAHAQILDRDDAMFEYHVCALGTFTPSGPGAPWKQRLIVTVDWLTETGITHFDDARTPQERQAFDREWQARCAAD